MPDAKASPTSSAVLNIDGRPSQPVGEPLRREHVGEDNIQGQFSAVINVHGCNLQQIEVALANNAHEVDRHPIDTGKFVARHPIYLVAHDYSQLDDNGLPTPGAPAELDLGMVRQVYSQRFSFVDPGDPPEDGSHIRVPGMHLIAEKDSRGVPTGRITRGDPEDVEA